MISFLLTIFGAFVCAGLYFRIKSMENHELYAFSGAALTAAVLCISGLPPQKWIFSIAFTGAAFSVYYFSPLRAALKRYTAAACVIIIISFILTGCSSAPVFMPAIKEEIKLTFTPSCIAVSAKDELYIGAENSGFVSVYSLREQKEIKKIKCGRYPSDIVIKGDMIYITGKLDDTLTAYNAVTGESSVMKVQGKTPLAVAVNPEQARAYTANSGSSNVSIIDLEQLSVIGKVDTGKWPSDVLLSSEGDKLYTACKYTNTIQVIDALKGKNLFTKIETGVSPVKLLPFGRRLVAVIHEWEYAFNHKSSVIFFDTESYTVMSSIITDGGIFDAAASKSRKYIYLSVPLKDKIIFVDAVKKIKTAEIYIKNSLPKALAVSRNGALLFAASQGSKRITVIKVNDLI